MPHNGTMEHNTPLISTIVAGLVLAFAFGVAAQRLKISPLVGYLLAGVVIGPFTPGYVADQSLANELAEIGVILLMFGVGLHFSLKDLLEVRAIAIPGAVVQIGAATVLGAGLGHALGWPFGAGLVFGLALSVASTVVLLRALQERRLVDSERGRIAVGWLIVEDIAMVLTLVLLPAVAGLLKGEATTANWETVLWPVAMTLGKVFAFMVFMLVVGRRIIPWMLHYVAHTGSRELFRLAVLAISLGVAFGAAVLFDVSLALGAFFAGMILSESELSHRAANETLPLRDAFAVLFFVSVGMLVDPGIVVREPLPLLVTVLIIVFGKSIAAFFIVRLFGHPNMTALTISASLAQIGEFSFILAGLGVSLGLMPERGRDLVLAGAIISIMLNPMMFVLLDRVSAKIAAAAEVAKQAAKEAAAAAMPAQPRGHIVLVGHGRVGSNVSTALRRAGADMVVIENDDERVARLQREGFTAINGNAAAQEILDEAEVAQAHGLLVAIPNAFEGGQIIAKARAVNPGLLIIARAHSAEEVTHLRSNGANLVIMGEDEIARAMIARLGVDAVSGDAAASPITSATAPASAGAAA
ncbi:YbaL family putative K(+) efflux transporter [Rhodopseudomonas palustris]|uniref:YbaL family putative K(+) efflux transporter n=1 Tax=Rhodopseudomonas palustris TaxID=1076 RepID=UPI0022F0C0C3|nr:YbaL family putative K(+) efflux transporter [Rhodopseudomonas palustris]WBU29016.1 YbaL family putative K(+) efflux transporter [Rhodopseudomonas palustris]